MRIDAITIFPEYLAPMGQALMGKAIEDGHLSVHVHNLRDWATDNHKSVDDRPAGGGPGMVMKPEVWGPALDDVLAGRVGTELATASEHLKRPSTDTTGYYGEAIEDERPVLIVPTPSGEPLTQAMAQEFSREQRLVFACGRYEGIDQRVFDDADQRYRVREVSIGDYVLIGGEVAVLVISEAVVRLIPGVLGNQDSHLEDSFSDGLLEGPSYTRPRVWRGHEVPDVLMGGDHKAIASYRRRESLLKTKRVRPDLLECVELSREDRFMLNARDVRTTVNVLMPEVEVQQRLAKAPKKLRRAGIRVIEIFSEQVDLTCEPDNMLVTQYQNDTGRAALAPVTQILVNSHTDLSLTDATKAVINVLGMPEYWYGTSDEGHGHGGIRASCAW